MWVSQTFGEKTSLATWKKQDHMKEKKSLPSLYYHTVEFPWPNTGSFKKFKEIFLNNV